MIVTLSVTPTTLKVKQQFASKVTIQGVAPNLIGINVSLKGRHVGRSWTVLEQKTVDADSNGQAIVNFTTTTTTGGEAEILATASKGTMTQNSNIVAITINYDPTQNLAKIPEDFPWEGRTWLGPPYISFLDYVVVRTQGKPSIRLEPHVEGVDPNIAREVDGRWYQCKPLDRILAKAWIKTDPLPEGYTVAYGGGRLGMDVYYHDGTRNYMLDWIPRWWLPPYPPIPDWAKDWINNYVPYGSDWTVRVIDLKIPDEPFPYIEDSRSEKPESEWRYAKANNFVIWLQVWDDHRGTIPNANAWFADAELYINPTPTPPITIIPAVSITAGLILTGIALI